MLRSSAERGLSPLWSVSPDCQTAQCRAVHDSAELVEALQRACNGYANSCGGARESYRIVFDQRSGAGPGAAHREFGSTSWERAAGRGGVGDSASRSGRGQPGSGGGAERRPFPLAVPLPGRRTMSHATHPGEPGLTT